MKPDVPLVQPPQVAPLLAHAVHLLNARRPRDAVVVLREVARLLPGDATILHDLGLACLECGQISEAITALRSCISIDPSFVDSHLRLGIALEAAGSVEAALAAYSRAADLSPAMAEATYRAANLLNNLGHATQAVEMFRRAAASAPPKPLGRIAMARALLAENRDAEAEKILRKVLATESDNAVALDLLGNTLADSGRFAEARRYFERAIERDPGLAGSNGDPSLAIFAPYTPNAHSLVARFPVLDNYYDPSRQSADGHNWLVRGMAPYMDEIQSPDWVRSYPANGQDALAYQPKGFLWDAAEKKGLNVKIYGEYVEYAGVTFINPDGTTNEPSWQQFYNDAVAYESGQTTQLKYANTVNVISEIPSVQKHAHPHFSPFDLGIPDQFRVDLWQQDFNKDVAAGTVPALTTLWIMCDHNGGPPGVAAEQADNDLAVGRIIDAISHSPVWKDSVIFITEDDAQDGVDHVDGHRSPGYVISPYVIQAQDQGGQTVVNSTAFTQVNMTRTVEQILGRR